MRRILKDGPWVITSACLLLALLCFYSFGAATSEFAYHSGINTWRWDARTASGTLTGGSDTIVFGSDIDVDFVMATYTDGYNPTAIGDVFDWSYNGQTGTVTINGKTARTYRMVVFDFPGA